MILTGNCDWAAVLSSAPTTVCSLGHLIRVSLDRDVSLLFEEMSKTDFKKTKNPQSLHASMLQIANMGWSSFNKASENMEEIRLLTLQVPTYVQDTVKVRSFCCSYSVK